MNFSEEGLEQTGEIVGRALLAGIKMYGPAAKTKIADALDYQASTGLKKHLEKCPGASEEVARQILREMTAVLREKS